MKDINTYTLMLELCRRMSNYLYDPEPIEDAVLEELNRQLGELHTVQESLQSHLQVYRSAIKSRSEAE